MLQRADMLCAVVRRAVVTATAFVVAVLATSTREAHAQAPCASSFPTSPIHVSSNKAVVLQLREGHRKYRTVCAAPCDVEVPIDATYRIAGDGIRASEDFVLAATCGAPVFLDVDASSKAAFIGGMVTASVGTATVCSAFMHMVLAGYSTEPSDRDRAKEQLLAAGITAGVGLGLVAIGLPIMLTNRRTLIRDPGEGRESPAGGTTASTRVRPAPEEEWTFAATSSPRAPTMIAPISFSF